MLENPMYLAGIMQTSFKKWFEFVLPDNQKNVTRKERVDIIDFEQFKTIEMQRLPTTQKPNEVWRAKMATAKLLKDAKEGGYLTDAVHDMLNWYLDQAMANDQKDLIEEEVHNRLLEIFPDLAKYLLANIACKMAKEHGLEDWLLKKEKQMDEEKASKQTYNNPIKQSRIPSKIHFLTEDF